MIRKLSNVIKEFGYGDGALYLLNRILSMVTDDVRIVYYDLVVQPVPSDPIAGNRIKNKLEFRELSASDPAMDDIPVPKPVVESRFEQDATCIGIFRDDRFVGYAWFCLGVYHEDELRIDYRLTSPHSAFDFDIYVFPEFRLGRAFLGLWEFLRARLREDDVTRTFSRISRFNLQSRRSHAQLGARQVGYILALKLWRAEFIWTDCPIERHVLFRRTTRAQIELDDN